MKMPDCLWPNVSRGIVRCVAAGIAALAMAPMVHAHRIWLLPSATVLSGNEAWITVDAAVSNTLFVFEHRPLRLDGLAVACPGGRLLQPDNPHMGQLRSSFDLRLNAPGTCRISVANSTAMASWKENGELKRWRGPLSEMAAHVPASADALQVSRNDMRAETYVTLGKPSRETLAPEGKGLEIVPVTHPNDLVPGEEAVFQVFLDGKPAAGVGATVVHAAGRHVERPSQWSLTSGADGSIRLKFPAAGYYWMQAAAGGAAPGSPGRRATCVLTLEVLPL